MSISLTGGRFSRKHKKVGLRQTHKNFRTFTSVIALFLVAFVATFFASSVFSPINASNAAETTVTATVSSGAYSITLTVTPNVTLNLVSSPTGAMTVGKAQVSAQTNSPNGYKLYLGMTGTNSTTNDLIHSTNSSYRLHSNGTFASPVALTDNTWGYAVEKSIADTTGLTNGFDASYSEMESATPTSAKFAAVPISTSAQQLINKTTSGNAGNPNIFYVYYGAMANYSAASGSYTNKVLYTGVADAGASAQMVVTPDETPAINGGDPLLITTTLYSTSDALDANAYILTAAEKTAADNNTLDWSTVASSKMSCTRDTTKTYLEMTCTNVAKPFGDYYVYVNVPSYGVHYSKAFSYVKNFYNITYMQDMTADICNDVKYVTTPGKNVYNGTTFSDSSEHSFPRATYADTGTAQFRPNHLGETNYVPETTLIDSRNSIFYKDGSGNYSSSGTEKTEQVSYTVRKLADGNCWMTENLALNFEEGRQFTTSDTNVKSTKTAAHATQSLDGVVQTWEQNQNKGTANTCTETTPIADRLCWYEGTTAGNFSDRWLSRSSNGDTEQSLSFPAAIQTGENQKVGTYYNWYTATMGSVTTADGQKEADEDICPTGWHLPNYNAVSGSWMYLIRDTYGFISSQGAQTDDRINNLLHKFPFSLPYGGYVFRTTGGWDYRSTRGYFWSEGASSGSSARYLGFNGAAVYPEYDVYKTYGLPVRCVASQLSN